MESIYYEGGLLGAEVLAVRPINTLLYHYAPETFKMWS